MVGKKRLVVLFLLSFASGGMGQVAPLSDVLVVSVNGENQAALIDPATYEVLSRLPTGINPHDIAVSADGRYAYVAVMGTPQEPGHSVTVLDLRRRAVKTTIELNPYKRCHDLRVSRDGARLWATCAPSKAVIELDTSSGRIMRNWKLDQEGAWMLVVTPDERKIYTANLEGKSVSVIDRRANIVRTLPFDSSQIGIDVAPNGREVWVHHMERRELSIIDVATDKVVATLPSGGQGFGRVKFTPDGKFVLVPQNESRNLAVFEATARKLIANIPLSATPKVMTIAPDGKRAIITSPESDLAMVIDLIARKEARTFPTGKTPDGIAWAVALEGR
jgi:DNA-binding beta-propeller fold protein YncE